MFGLLPYQEVMILSVILSLISVLASRFLTDQNELKRIRNEMRLYNERLKKFQKKGDEEEVRKLTNEIMKLSQKQFSYNMKPMMTSMLVFIAAIQLMAMSYPDMTVVLPFPLPFLGNQLNWFWWYFFCILPFSMFFRKVFDVQ